MFKELFEQLLEFVLLFFLPAVLENCKSVFLILKIPNVADEAAIYAFWDGNHVRIDIKIDNLHFYKTNDHQMWHQQVHLEELTQIRPIKQLLLMPSYQNYVTNEKYIPSTKVSLASKLGRMVTYLDRLLPIKVHDPITSWFCEFNTEFNISHFLVFIVFTFSITTLAILGTLFLISKAFAFFCTFVLTSTHRTSISPCGISNCIFSANTSFSSISERNSSGSRAILSSFGKLISKFTS